MDNKHTMSMGMKAEDQKTGMTLGELRLFLSQVDAFGLGNDEVKISGEVGFKSQLQSLKIKS